MKNYIAIKIETNGLPEKKSFSEYYDPSILKMYSSSRVVGIAIYSNNFTKYKIIKPTDFTINNATILGFDNTYAIDKGITLEEYFDQETIEVLNNCEGIIGHNIMFDVNVLASELIRQNHLKIKDLLLSKPTICTMYTGQTYLKQLKLPTLSELYFSIFQEKGPYGLEKARASFICHEHINKKNTKAV